ncbi:MAG: AGE family epimerase/isomerase [Anaerolineae bacterium]
MDARSLAAFYTDHLCAHILPFWQDQAIDYDNGGYFTCFANRGKRLLHRHKFTWSQGRFVWVWSRLAGQFHGRVPEEDTDRYLEYAHLGAEFLMSYALLPNGNCSFILSERGEPILLDAEGNARQAGPGEVYDTSIYADCFVVYGMSEYARVTAERGAFEFAANLFDGVLRRIASGVYRTDPYPVPAGYKAHGIPMILLETARELALTTNLFDAGRAASLRQSCRGYAAEIMDHHMQADGTVIEYLGVDNRVRDTMLGTYINPGHTLECMWFVLHYAQEIGDADLIARAVQVIRQTMEIGWDAQYGGVPQFLHRSGGAPRGSVPPELEDEPMLGKLRTAWSNKLWWPQSEAIYALSLAYRLTREQWCLDWLAKVNDYTFRTFPQPEGDWVQIRDREGRPEDKVVALPVKDPFHIPRALLHAIRALEAVEP